MGNQNLAVDESTLAVLHELSSLENTPVQTVLERAVDNYRQIVAAPRLAPDGLPWPPGYFDCRPRKTFEEALAAYGVRPNHYFKGWPVYTDVEASKPEFKAVLPDEPPELEEKWRKDWETWERSKSDSTVK